MKTIKEECLAGGYSIFLLKIRFSLLKAPHPFDSCWARVGRSADIPQTRESGTMICMSRWAHLQPCLFSAVYLQLRLLGGSGEAGGRLPYSPGLQRTPHAAAPQPVHRGAGAASAHVADTCQSPSGRLLALTLSVGDFGLTFHAPDFQITFWKENFKIFSENPNQFFVH